MPEPTPGLGQDSREETAVPSTGMAIVSPSLRLKRLLWRAVHGVFYLGVRPLAQRVPFRTLDRLGGVLAIPMGLLLVVFGAHHRRRYLRQLGEPATGLPLIRYCVREVRARLRETFGYLRPDVPIQVRPGAAAWAELDGASVLVSWSAFGTIRMGIWTTETRCRFVRIPFGGEGGALPSEVPDVTQRWIAEKARVRDEAFSATQLVPGGSVTQYLRALRSGTPLLILQDVIVEPGTVPNQSLLGLSVPVPTGAARLARAADAPVYVLTGGIQDGVPWVDVEGPIPSHERAVLDRMEAFIRAEPWAWAHWDLALRRAAPATEAAEVVSEASTAPAPQRVPAVAAHA